MKRGRETRQRAGHPPRLPIAGRGTGRQGPRLWAACRPARGLPWPCRPAQRPALPPAGGVPLRPAAREARGRRRLRRQCARRSKLRPPAGARAAAAARSRGPGSAGGRHPQRGAPGRYAGRRVRRQSRRGTACAAGVAGLARLAGAPPTGPEGRTAPKPPFLGAGPPRSTCAATGAGEEQSKARRRRLVLALLCGGVPPRNGWRPT